METKTNIGIIGNGFVGSAIAHGFSLWANLRIFDRDPRLSTDSLVSVIQNSEIIFVCVPTPMDASNGNKIDLSILDYVNKHRTKLESLDEDIEICERFFKINSEL